MTADAVLKQCMLSRNDAVYPVWCENLSVAIEGQFCTLVPVYYTVAPHVPVGPSIITGDVHRLLHTRHYEHLSEL